MKKFLLGIIIVSLLALTFLAGCEAESGDAGQADANGGEEAATGGQVHVHNWGEFIDPEVLEIFEREYGIRVIYNTYATNQVLYAQLSMGTIVADVVIPSDYMIARLIDEDMLYELNFDNIPNVELIDPRFRNLEFDPDERFSVPYMTGTVGIIYNTRFITETPTSWGALWDERWAGQILMFDNPRDAFGIALKYLGFSQNTINEDEILQAFDLLVAQRDVLQAYVMDQIFDLMESGEAWIGPYYMGDFLWMHDANPDLAFSIPVEGTNAFVDAMVIPRGAPNRENAEKFINFMASTEIALMNMSAIMYSSANYEAAALYAAEIEPWKYAIMFPPAEIMDNTEVFRHLPQHILDLYDRLWIELKS